jgi:hypothetical protein
LRVLGKERELAMTEEKRLFRTTDIYLASFLRAKGFNISQVDRQGYKCQFCFDDTEEREQAVLDYYNEESLISALKLWNAFHAVKSLTYGSQQGPAHERK